MRPTKPNESCDQKAAIRQVPEPACAPSVKVGAAIKTLSQIGSEHWRRHSMSLDGQAREASVKKINDGLSQISIILAMCDVRGVGTLRTSR